MFIKFSFFHVMNTSNQKRTLTLEEYNRRAMSEIGSDDNRWYAGQALQHSPSNLECAEHFINSGGLQHLHEQYQIKPPEQCAA